MTVLVFLLLYTIILKFFPPKKPNFYYGYQLGSAKKSVEHWKLANKYAANYLIFLYSSLIVLLLLFDYLGFNGGLLVLPILIMGLIAIYFSIERKLKAKIAPNAK
ncbi:SdpI family protein [Flavobacterium sp.]|uniref:SdpI family protein n=1 Tax=Flavobacterium sp. TaxID=239 RepID=UPI0026076A4C|nr:SdpI family protein [Flavobacterium sp.]